MANHRMTGSARLLVWAALIAALGCGSAGTARRDSEPRRMTLAELFPASRTSLLATPMLELLPADTVAVAMVPSLRHAHERLGVGGRGLLDRDTRVALSVLLEGRFGHDLLDLDHVSAAGVRLDAPAAVALIDFDTAALVLPLRDPVAFRRAWRESDAAIIHIAPGHAVVAFALGHEIDPASDASLYGMDIAKEASLAADPGVRRALSRLTYGPDAAVLVRVAPWHELAAQRADDAGDELAIDDLREQSELARDSGDRDAMADALDDLWAAEAMHERLRSARRLLDELMAPVDVVAVGVGVDGSLIKLQAALGLVSPERGWSRLVALPRPLRAVPGRDLALSLRVPAHLVGPLIDMVASGPERDAAHAALRVIGGPRALDGVVSLEADTRATASGRMRRAVLVRLGLREPAKASAALRTGYRRGQAERLTARVDSGQLVLASRDVARDAAPADAVREALSTAPGLAASFALDLATVAALIERHETRGDQGDIIGMLVVGDDDEERAEYNRLVEERDRLAVQHGDRVHALRTELVTGLGRMTGVAAVQRDGLVVHLVQHMRVDDVRSLAVRVLRFAYERSESSPQARRIEELRARIATLHGDLDMSVISDVSGSSSLSGPGGAVLGGITGPAGSLGPASVGHGVVPGKQPARDARHAAPLRVTVSLTHAGAGVDRAMASEVVLAAVPGLRACYHDQRALHADAGGYVTAELGFGAGAVAVRAVRAASSARSLGDAAWLACVGDALRRVPAGGLSGAVIATLWFGAE